MFGMPLSQVIACATVNAARIFPAFDDRGTLNVGAPADVAVLELRQGMFEFLDNYNSKRNGKSKAVPGGSRDGRQGGAATHITRREPPIDRQ
jgi:dihydroorotase